MTCAGSSTRGHRLLNADDARRPQRQCKRRALRDVTCACPATHMNRELAACDATDYLDGCRLTARLLRILFRSALHAQIAAAFARRSSRSTPRKKLTAHHVVTPTTTATPTPFRLQTRRTSAFGRWCQPSERTLRDEGSSAPDAVQDQESGRRRPRRDHRWTVKVVSRGRRRLTPRATG